MARDILECLKGSKLPMPPGAGDRRAIYKWVWHPPRWVLSVWVALALSVVFCSTRCVCGQRC